MEPNIFTVQRNAGVLCVECRLCGHRNALTVDRIKIGRRNEMSPLSDLPLKCAECGATDVDWLVPLTMADVVKYVTGGEIPTNARSRRPIQ